MHISSTHVQYENAQVASLVINKLLYQLKTHQNHNFSAKL